jgi:hypothetical protein
MTAAWVAFAAMLVSDPAAANTPSVFESDQEFRLRTHVDRGLAIRIEGINGDLIAEASTSGDVEVIAVKRSGTGSHRRVRMSVDENLDGTTIRALFPEGSDAEVRFYVRVPAGVRFVGRMQNGRVKATKLRSAVDVRTVNGDIDIESESAGAASTVNGSITASLREGGRLETVNGNVTVRLPQNPAELDAHTVHGAIMAAIPFAHLSQFRHNHWHGKIGAERIAGVKGGPVYDVRTVSGDIHLERI